ncbi:hypothetical protein LIER_41552 [Lithospermum erythrorhizon]|uniref:Uncharacterized protein n=1 Tax=Lithospermum erythrorhizon TaxID=34254 RepID=A0AAV3RF08_LITER
MDLPHEPPSPSLPGKRPSDRFILQGKEKRVRAAFELSDPPKSGIPPPPFPDYDPLMATGFFTTEFLTPSYTLLGGQQICEGTPFKSNLQSFHVVANAGFELARRAHCLGEENKDLLSQGPSGKIAELEEESARVKKELVEGQRINVLLKTEKKKLMEDYFGLHKKHEEITLLSEYRDAVAAEASSATEEVNRLEAVVKRLKVWAALENFKQSAEFEGALSVAVEHFKKSSEFLDALGVDVAYGAYNFVRKYKKKYPDLCSDYEKLQEYYNSSPLMPPLRMRKRKPLPLAKLPLRTRLIYVSFYPTVFCNHI